MNDNLNEDDYEENYFDNNVGNRENKIEDNNE